MPSFEYTMMIVHSCEAQEFWELVGGIAAVAVSVMAACVLLPRIWSVVSKWLDWLNRNEAKRFLLIGTLLLAGYAGSKGFIAGRVYFPFTDPETKYLLDSGSYVTNDYVHVDFTRFLVPDSANLYVDACPVASTNVAMDSFSVWEGTFAEFNPPQDIPYDAASNFNFYVYTDWTPGPAVHTNGVLQLSGRQDMSGKGFFVPSRTGIYEDGQKLAPSNIVIEADLSMPPLSNTPDNEEEP